MPIVAAISGATSRLLSDVADAPWLLEFLKRKALVDPTMPMATRANKLDMMSFIVVQWVLFANGTMKATLRGSAQMDRKFPLELRSKLALAIQPCTCIFYSYVAAESSEKLQNSRCVTSDVVIFNRVS